MPSTTTTNVTVSTLLDVLGAAAPSLPVSKTQPAFDVLLQPPLVNSARPAPQESDDPPPPPPAPHADGPNGQTVEQQLPTDGGESQHDSNAKSAPPQPAGSSQASAEAAKGEQRPQENEPVVAESLAGLAAVAPQIAAVEAPVSAPETNAQETAVNAAAIPRPTAPAQAAAKIVQPAEIKTEKTVDAKDSSKDSTSGNANAPRPVLAQAAATQTPDKVAVPEPSKPAQTNGDTNTALSKDQTVAGDEFATTTDSTPPLPAAHVPHETPPTLDPAAVKSDAPATLSPQSPDVALAVNVNTSPPSAVAFAAPAAPLPSGEVASSPSNASGITSFSASSRFRLPGEVLSQQPGNVTRRPTIEVDTTRLLARVARAFTAAQERDGEVRLRLSPPELGSLRLEVRVQDGALVARLQTETDAARTAILDNLPTLRDRLADQGVRIERFDVDLMQRPPGGMPDQSGGRQQEQGAAPAMPFASTLRPRAAVAVSQSAPPPSTDNASGLNVII